MQTIFAPSNNVLTTDTFVIVVSTGNLYQGYVESYSEDYLLICDSIGDFLAFDVSAEDTEVFTEMEDAEVFLNEQQWEQELVDRSINQVYENQVLDDNTLSAIYRCTA